MKNSIVRSVFAAAVLTAAATGASAQTYNAEIPVAFRVGATQMLPGAYEITAVRSFGGSPVLNVKDLDHKRSVFLNAPSATDVLKAWKAAGKPVIAFECIQGSCSLSHMWNGSDPVMYLFPAHKTAAGEARASLVVVKLNAAD
jgi:hypothetical protein